VVIKARDKAVYLKGCKDNLQAEWNRENQKLLDYLTQAGADVAVEEARLRELTLQVYTETGNKSPAVGVSVKIFEVLNYRPDEAKAWAISHGLALKLDVPVFEKVAKADTPDFVKIITEPQATIAIDLNAVLEEKK